MDIELHPDFRDFLKSLNANHVEYLIVGGYAVSFHGYPRATDDLDVWVARSPKNAENIVQAIRKFGFATSNLREELFLDERTIVRMGHPPVRIDVMTRIDGVEFDDCFAHRINANVGGVAVTVIDRDSLKRNKAASGRHKDLDDLEHLA